jgi:hypothetical protein
VATKLVCSNYEPHSSYSHQEPEADYTKRKYSYRIVYVDVQTESLKHPKPDDQSEYHEHSCTNEVFHQRCTPRQVSSIHIGTVRKSSEFKS